MQLTNSCSQSFSLKLPGKSSMRWDSLWKKQTKNEEWLSMEIWGKLLTNKKQVQIKVSLKPEWAASSDFYNLPTWEEEGGYSYERLPCLLASQPWTNKERARNEKLFTKLGVLAAITETARKTSLKNKHLRNCDYFAIIPSCSHFTM